jgi:hypothetical protein
MVGLLDTLYLVVNSARRNNRYKCRAEQSAVLFHLTILSCPAADCESVSLVQHAADMRMAWAVSVPPASKA